MFMFATDCYLLETNAEFIENVLMDAIENIGPHLMVQVVSDYVPICNNARMMVESKYHYIFWTPCIIHNLNLALQHVSTQNTLDCIACSRV
jgi:hypothetical protein